MDLILPTTNWVGIYMTCVVNSSKDKLNERYFFESEVTERPMLDARAGKMDDMINRRGKGFDTKKTN